VRVFFFGLTAFIVMSGCGGFEIPIHAPDPYSDALIDYLGQPRLGRDGVQRWLGPPAATRMGGTYEVYVALRERDRDITGNPRVDYFYLLIEYDGRDQVVRHNKFVDGGCTNEMLCIARHEWRSPFKQSLAEIRDSAILQLVLYATPEMDRQAKDSLTAPEECRHFIYRSDGTAMVMLVDSANGKMFRLPADGYLVLPGECESQQIAAAWSDWKGNFEEQLFSVGGAAPSASVTRLDLAKVEYWGWQFSLSAVDQPLDAGANEIQSRRLVLR